MRCGFLMEIAQAKAFSAIFFCGILFSGAAVFSSGFGHFSCATYRPAL